MNGIKLPLVLESEKTPLVTQLMEIIRQQNEMMQAMRDDIARLKGQKAKPVFKPSKMEESTQSGKVPPKKRPGSAKRQKTKELKIHQTQVIRADDIPTGSVFKGYSTFVVQDLNIEPNNTLYQMERWLLPDGSYAKAELPKNIEGHYGVKLKSYIIYQYHHCHVTQPLLLLQLQEFGVDISAGQLNLLLTEKTEIFNREKDEILSTGLEISTYVQTDDTGSRHRGKTGYCTHIGNELFAWFKSTEHKSRMNFIELISAGKTGFLINEDSLKFMRMCKIVRAPLVLGLSYVKKRFETYAEWNSHLFGLGIWDNRSQELATEAALLASLIDQGLNRDLVILSDDAGQFELNILDHALCWVHAERMVHKLIPETIAHRNAQEKCRDKIWILYRKLKSYKKTPSLSRRKWIEKTFEQVFTGKTGYPLLNECLGRIYKNKSELLLVLDRPEIPLHNNSSERDIREYVKRRKISGSTRSDAGRASRDTFTSLKKTSRKLGVSFWNYLQDRLAGTFAIVQLSELMRLKASNSSAIYQLN